MTAPTPPTCGFCPNPATKVQGIVPVCDECAPPAKVVAYAALEGMLGRLRLIVSGGVAVPEQEKPEQEEHAA